MKLITDDTVELEIKLGKLQETKGKTTRTAKLGIPNQTKKQYGNI